MSASDRYIQPARRRRSAAGETAVAVPRAFLLEQIRAQTVMLNAWRALAGLGPVSPAGGVDVDTRAPDVVE